MINDSVAIIHSTALERGGGIQVVEEMARSLNAPVYFGFCADGVYEKLDPDLETYELFGNRLFSRFKHRSFLRNLYFISQFQHVPELHEYDIIIQSGDGASWYVPCEGQGLIRYVHSPPGPPYHRFDEIGSSFMGKWSGFISRALRQPYQKLPTLYLANSETTRDRCRQYLDRDPPILYPPIPTNKYSVGKGEDFYLTLSRLTPAKNVDEIVEVFTNKFPGTRLVVAGSGPQEDYLRSIAGENVDIRGWVSEDEKQDLLQSAKGFILNSGNESFGITPIEALASGTPVLGVDDGHTSYQITDGETGILYDRGELAAAVERFEIDDFSLDRTELAAHADQYSVEEFRTQLRDHVAWVTEHTSV